DRAGQFSKRFAGSSGTVMLESEGSCPLLAAYQAFADRGRMQKQMVELADSSGNMSAWFTVSQAVWPQAGRGHDGGGDLAQFVVILGLEARLAGQLTQARGMVLSGQGLGQGATQIGMGCARCFRGDCLQRSVPPRGAGLVFDERVRGVSAFGLKW
ncbi:MAG: hypothetical protein RLY97_1789, partial [Pseudomonadota bacterium]